MPLNFSNRSAIRFMIFWSAAVSPEGKNRYQRPNCSLSAAVLKPIVEVESVAKAGSACWSWAPKCHPATKRENSGPDLCGRNVIGAGFEEGLATEAID